MVDNLLPAHARQYVIAEEPTGPAGYVSTALWDGLVLSYDPRLPVAQLRDRDGMTWHLLGNVVPTVGEAPDALSVAELSSRQVLAAAHTWSGRWQLLGEGLVRMDAAGSMGCYFSAGPRRRVSSSVALMNARAVGPTLGPGEPVTWFPGPASGHEGVSRLLPSQALELPSMRLTWRGLLTEPASDLRPDDVLALLQESFVHLVRSAAATAGRVLLPLTAGLDSRLLLAACVEAGVDALCYTQTHSGMSQADRRLPPQLAGLARLEHRLIEGGRMRSDVLRRHAEHTGNQTRETGARFMASGQFDWVRADDILLGGGGFETARCFYWSRLDEEVPRTGSDLAGAFRSSSSEAAKGFGLWLEWIQQHPEALDWRDRFYWEQRMGGWLAASEQAMDLVPCARLLGANTRHQLSLLLSLEVEERRGGRHQRRLIERMAPRLLSLPVNPPDPLLRRRWRRARGRVARRWAQYRSG